MTIANLETLGAGFCPADQDEFDRRYPFSRDEILCLMDENEKHMLCQFEDNYTRALNTPVTDEDLPF